MAVIRRATYEDIDTIAKIAGDNNEQLGWVRKSAMKDNIAKNELIVAEEDGAIVAFCLYHLKRQGYITVYDICTDKKYRRRGIGMELMRYLNRSPIQLKVTEDNEEANAFYLKLGGIASGREPGRKRALIIYRFKKGVIA